jgi:glycerol-1-phosphate dehydrogenase [NAD(P)+]
LLSHAWPIPKIEYLSWADITENRRPGLLFTPPLDTLYGERLPLSFACRMAVEEASIRHWAQLADAFVGNVVYALGGGLAVDGAKYVAARRGIPLVSLPTAISVDAFWTWASGYRERGCVRYVETTPPERTVIDWDVLKAAPEHVRAAGICDVLSIATGCFDWMYAHQRGMNPPQTPYISHVFDGAQAILRGALACAEEAGRGEPEGLKELIDALALEVQLCNLIGHSRPEEGSEHYFAYSVENVMGKGLPHGDLVGPGILLLAHIQGQDVAPLRTALEACKIPLRSIPRDVCVETLRQLPAYVREQELPYGIAYDLLDTMIEPAVEALFTGQP